MTTDAITAFVAAHPPQPGLSADHLVAIWDDLSSLADVDAIATDASNPAARVALEDAAAFRRQLAAAVRWVQAHHGDAVADSFVTYLGNASTARGTKATPPAP
ncbi:MULTISPECIES: hypothetical protein [unclassified Streptomyces]|uniref:hypothetical protein n=1 Tax=unclassified Streptomyces TaxID=2593676 RepID=UPI00081F59E4|nr:MULTISPECIES: hypothetical protein [unclassified Streptomyces]MYR28614.1 hypothetical protein [Streptomyces sp. SID4945]SCF39635.1 hypothetical protein GA0115257_11527 [Streptomyces sp. LcepLS]